MVVFLAGSLGIYRVSRKSLRNPGRRGLFRMVAFESLLALVLLNLERWFWKPLAFQQLLSWKLLILSGYLAAAGFLELRREGRPDGEIEATTVLVQSGPYRQIRHPLYASLIYLGWGAFLKHPAPGTGILAGLATGSLIQAAKIEEAENLAKFGPAYAGYMRRTKRFIPFLI